MNVFVSFQALMCDRIVEKIIFNTVALDVSLEINTQYEDNYKYDNNNKMHRSKNNIHKSKHVQLDLVLNLISP